ncbi:MAG: hypothetical protein ACPIOQ_62605, partial [Promethearchaeia archaeon]
SCHSCCLRERQTRPGGAGCHGGGGQMADSMDNDEPLHRLEALLDTVSQVGASAPGGNGLRAVRGAAGATRKWFGAAGVAGS